MESYPNFSSAFTSSIDTVETKILEKAAQKRKLEDMVISRGNFQAVDQDGKVSLGKNPKDAATAWARKILDFDAEAVNIVSKDDKVIR